ncbi:MAG: hypothetical protein ACRDJY_07675 [Thermoleophilaceae bacterium]
MRPLLNSLTLAELALLPAEAAAAATPVEARALGEWRAKGEVTDTIVAPAAGARAAAARVEQFTDEHGHTLTLATDLPDLDLLPFAEILAGLHHRGEIEDAIVEVAAPESLGEICGNPDAVACYAPEDPDLSLRGRIWIPSGDADLLHVVAHEYGHHVDNQLVNLGHLDSGCGFDNDGSRNWFFERDADERIFEAGISCHPEAQWTHVLGEIYAEDYTWLSGNRAWRWDMPLKAPTDEHLDALAGDLAAPFETRARRYERFMEQGSSRFIHMRLHDWTLVTARLTGRPAADLDLFLYTSGSELPFAGSARPRSREELQGALPPGSYKLEIFAHSKSGQGTLRLYLE